MLGSKEIELTFADIDNWKNESSRNHSATESDNG